MNKLCRNLLMCFVFFLMTGCDGDNADSKKLLFTSNSIAPPKNFKTNVRRELENFIPVSIEFIEGKATVGPHLVLDLNVVLKFGGSDSNTFVQPFWRDNFNVFPVGNSFDFIPLTLTPPATTDTNLMVYPLSDMPKEVTVRISSFPGVPSCRLKTNQRTASQIAFEIRYSDPVHNVRSGPARCVVPLIRN